MFSLMYSFTTKLSEISACKVDVHVSVCSFYCLVSKGFLHVSFQIQEERDRRHKEADMLEAHIMQAQAAATAADERELQRISEGYENYQALGLPPGTLNWGKARK